MSEDAITRLQAMYHSGQLSAYIMSKLPEGKLATGWIEQGLLSKGFSGGFQDKKLQEDLVIPIDRFSRLVRDYNTETNFGLFILGEQGFDKSRLVTLVNNLSHDRKRSITAIGFKSNNIQAQELINIIIRLLFKKKKSEIYTDPNLDYIEEFLTEGANGNVRHLLSLSILKGKHNLTDWLRKTLKTDLKSGPVTAKFGNPHEISSSILLLARWLLGLEIFKKTKKVIASILFVQGSQIMICFWDSPRNLATFVIMDEDDIESILRKFSLPLWFTSDDISEDTPKGPKVVIEKRKRKSAQTSISENSIGQLSPDSMTSDNQLITIVRNRLAEMTSRLNPLISNVGVLEKRITKVTNDTRFQSMSEHSENVIDELRYIENETRTLQDLSVRLRQMEKQLDAASSDPASSPLGSDEIQRIVSKMTKLRELIDKVEVEIGQLDSRVTQIESLKFKRRTES